MTLARKILVRGARGAAVGAAHITNVLRGKAGETVTSRGPDVEHHGLLADASVAGSVGYIEQLTGQAFLKQAGDEFPILVLTDRASHC